MNLAVGIVFLDLVMQRVVLFDGALGTTLIARGISSGEAPEKWNVEKPEVVKEIHLLPAWIAENGGFNQGNEELDDSSHYRPTEC